MVGILVVTHGRIGEVLIEVAKAILKEEPEAVIPVSIDLSENAGNLRKRINNALKNVSQNKGILILTDMFGGTPSNLSYSFLEEKHVEVLAGVNLPILITALTQRKKKNLSELVISLEKSGKDSISVGTKILKGNKRS
jgi:PTS system mannose-specific IIA component